MTKYTESDIIAGISQRDNEVLKYIYEFYFPVIRQLISRNNGTLDDAAEIFQEAIIVVFDQTRNRPLNLHCSLKTYLYSISRHLWLQHLERSRRNISFEDVDQYIAMEETDKYDDHHFHRKRIYQKHFLTLTERCQKILELFLMNKSFDQIARIMGFSNRHYAIKRKYECTKSLMKRIYDDPEFKKYYL